MRLTDVEVVKIKKNGRVKAIANIVMDNEFCIRGIEIIEKNNKLFIAMPSKRTPNGEIKDIAHPINNETREKIQKAILEEYETIK